MYALEDRCAHRQVPLHLGVVCENQLKCHYHGWSYNGGGQCVEQRVSGVMRRRGDVEALAGEYTVLQIHECAFYRGAADIDTDRQI